MARGRRSRDSAQIFLFFFDNCAVTPSTKCKTPKGRLVTGKRPNYHRLNLRPNFSTRTISRPDAEKKIVDVLADLPVSFRESLKPMHTRQNSSGVCFIYDERYFIFIFFLKISFIRTTNVHRSKFKLANVATRYVDCLVS